MSDETMEEYKNIIFLRVAKLANSDVGLVDIITSPYEFSPFRDEPCEYLINLKTIEFNDSFPLSPFYVAQNQNLIYFISRQTVTYIFL